MLETSGTLLGCIQARMSRQTLSGKEHTGLVLFDSVVHDRYSGSGTQLESDRASQARNAKREKTNKAHRPPHPLACIAFVCLSACVYFCRGKRQ